MRIRIVEFIERRGLLVMISLVGTIAVILQIFFEARGIYESRFGTILGWIAFILVVLWFLISIGMSLTSSKSSGKLFVGLLVMVVMSLLSFTLHLNGSTIFFVLSIGMIITTSILQAILSPFRIKGNSFLSIIGGMASLILAAGFAITLFKMQRWSGADFMMSYSAPLFVALTVIILIGVQLTDFDKWRPDHRTFLIRNILIPWSAVFVLGGSLLLFPDQFYGIFKKPQHWGMQHYDIPQIASEPEFQ